MNEQIIKNIALCYENTEKNQVEVMLSFAKLLMNKDVSKLFYLNDYLESALTVDKREPFIRNILRDILENSIDEPGIFFKMVAESDFVEDKNGVIDHVRERMMEKGYYEEFVTYVCPECRHEILISEFMPQCEKCSHDTVKHVANIRRGRKFRDFFLSELAAADRGKRNEGKNKKIISDQHIEVNGTPEGYIHPGYAPSQDTGLPEEEPKLSVNPFFKKRNEDRHIQ